MNIEENKKYIIKIVLSNLQNFVSIVGQIISIQGGEVRSLYLSPKGLDGVREMIIEYEGRSTSVNSLIKNVTQIEGCIKAVVKEFPATLIETKNEVDK